MSLSKLSHWQISSALEHAHENQSSHRRLGKISIACKTLAMTIRQFLLTVFCCWLPLSGVAAMTLDCHLANPSVIEDISTPALADALMSDHGDCGGNAKPDDSAQAGIDVESPCKHCQSSCHTLPFVLHTGSSFAPASQISPSLYALPFHAIVFLENPQRPPQSNHI